MTTIWEKYTGLVMISAIALAGGVSAWHADWRKPLDMPFEDGITQAALEDSYDDALILREPAIQVWNALWYSVFSETRNGAISGKEGWLYTTEEYDSPPDYDQRLTRSLETIVATRDSLAARDIDLLIALIPDKARIMDEHLARPRAPRVEARYDRALADLAKDGLVVADLRPALEAAGTSGPVYLRTDTHWTAFGAQTVAAELAPTIKAATPTRTAFDSTPSGTKMHHGDLYSFLDVGPFAQTLALEDEEIALWQTVKAPADTAAADLSGGLFGDAPAPEAALVGTSYSALKNWNFLGFLQGSSSTDILNFSQEGRGPFAPMDDFLADLDSGAVSSPRLVIWEIPERYLTVEP